MDTNGEYRSAFEQASGGSVEGGMGALCLSSATREESRKISIPYWFLNSEDFVRLFQAAPTVQRPILVDAIRRSKEGTASAPAWRQLRADIIQELNRIIGLSRGSDKGEPRTIRQLAEDLLRSLGSPTQIDAIRVLETIYTAEHIAQVSVALRGIVEIVREGINQEGAQFERYEPIGAEKRRRINVLIVPILEFFSSTRIETGVIENLFTADTPSWFDKEQFRNLYLNQAMDHEESGRARDHCATLLLRINRLLEDPRFEFLFGPLSQQWPNLPHSLATFLRDILGLPSAENTNPPLSAHDGSLPFYNRQRTGTIGHKVVIIDLSLLASEVLDNVTALIGRLLLEFLQRLGEIETETESARGSLPVVLVLEEAQNYIREKRFDDEESISRTVFERIAREGRKYGLSLVVASQRPSELSKTVLSQCGSFIVHRLQNPEDLKYFKEIVPGIYGPLLEQLPSLAPQTALVLGECVRAPALVKIREARPIPRSRDPKFYKYWVETNPPPVPVEAVCSTWEGSLGELESVVTGETEAPDAPSIESQNSENQQEE